MDGTYHHADEVLRSYQKHALFIGDVAAAEDVSWLKNNKIGVVITVASGFNLSYDSSITHIRYDLQDNKNENISAYFDQCSRQIQRYLRTCGVLVHCGAGVSRSATVIIAYLIKYKGMTFSQGLKFLKSKRPQVCPNLGFELQLKNYEAKQHATKIYQAKKNGERQEERNRQLAQNVKMPAFSTTTYNKSFYPQILSRGSNQSMTKQEKPQSKYKQQMEYIRRMAQFRFGITNMSRWRLGNRHEEIRRKDHHL